MLRTVLTRNTVLTDSLRKAVRSNVVRCISTELARRKTPNSLLTPSQQTKVATPQWSMQRYYASYPDHIKVSLPALSPTMENGSIVSWTKKEGDKVNEGDVLCEIETDKATMGFETPEEGFLAKIIVQGGAKGVPVGKLICIIVPNEADVAAFKDFKDDSPPPPPPAKAAKAADSAPAAPAPAPAAPRAAPAAPAPAPAAPRPAAPAPQEGRVYASPMAKRLAELKNIRLGGTGSGLYGSLKAGDLSGAAAGGAPSAAAPTPAPGASFVDIPLSGMRETIARRLAQSKQTIPHYQLSVTVNIEKTLNMRKAMNEKLAAEKSTVKLSVNDFIVKAVAAACKRVPAVNAHWMDSFIRQFSNVDVSVAVATPTGLITPILFNADSRGVLELSTNMKELAAKAKDGKLQPQEYVGGTVTISNLGMYGITMFNAIINPPQSLIVACGGLQELIIADKDSPQGFRPAKFVTFTASADHRVVDGAVGAQFMKALKENMEDPANNIL